MSRAYDDSEAPHVAGAAPSPSVFVRQPSFMDATTAFFGVSTKNLCSKSRAGNLPRIRHMARAYLHFFHKMSNADVGAMVWHNDHSTVTVSIQTHLGYMQSDKEYRNQYFAYCKALEGVKP